MNTRHILITGCNGWLGSRLLDQFEGSHYQPVGIGRHGNSTMPFLLSDLSKSNAAETLANSYREQEITANTLIHCAGLAHQPIETIELKQRFHDVNVNGTQQVIRFCQEVGIQRIVYISSIAAYDWQSQNDRPLIEESVMNPTTEYARTKLTAERIVAESGLDWRAVRLATVFGTGDPANFLKLSQSIRNKRFIIPGSGSARKSVIPVELAARLICSLAAMDAPPHRLTNLALPQAPQLKEVCDAFFESCEFPECHSLPIPLLRLMAKAGDAISLLRPFPLTTSTLNKLTQSTWVDTSRMQENFPNETFGTFAQYLNLHRAYYQNPRH